MRWITRIVISDLVLTADQFRDLRASLGTLNALPLLEQPPATWMLCDFQCLPLPTGILITRLPLLNARVMSIMPQDPDGEWTPVLAQYGDQHPYLPMRAWAWGAACLW